MHLLVLQIVFIDLYQFQLYEALMIMLILNTFISYYFRLYYV